MQLNEGMIEVLAAAAHMANRAYCRGIGDFSQPLWRDAPDWMKESARSGVVGVLERGDGPRESHATWMAEKVAAGWTWGEVKDAERRTHPCLVEYDQLPPEQQAKDDILVQTIQQVWGSM